MRLLQAFGEFRGPELSAWVERGQWGVSAVCVGVRSVLCPSVDSFPSHVFRVPWAYC